MKPRNLRINCSVALLFAVANLSSYLLVPQYSIVDDGFVYFGWPFSVYAYCGYFGHAVIIWTGLIGNVFVALCANRILGRIWEKILTHRRPFNRRAAIRQIETNAVDEICFVQAFADVHSITEINTNWMQYQYVTDSGIMFQIFQERFGRPPAEGELQNYKSCLVNLLETHRSRDSSGSE